MVEISQTPVKVRARWLRGAKLALSVSCVSEVLDQINDNVQVWERLLVYRSYLIEYETWAQENSKCKYFQVNISWSLWWVKSFSVNKETDRRFIIVIDNWLIPHPNAFCARLHGGTNFKTFHLVKNTVKQEWFSSSIRASNRKNFYLLLSWDGCE